MISSGDNWSTGATKDPEEQRAPQFNKLLFFKCNVIHDSSQERPESFDSTKLISLAEKSPIAARQAVSNIHNAKNLALYFRNPSDFMRLIKIDEITALKLVRNQDVACKIAEGFSTKEVFLLLVQESPKVACALIRPRDNAQKMLNIFHDSQDLNSKSSFMILKQVFSAFDSSMALLLIRAGATVGKTFIGDLFLLCTEYEKQIKNMGIKTDYNKEFDSRFQQSKSLTEKVGMMYCWSLEQRLDDFEIGEVNKGSSMDLGDQCYGLPEAKIGN